MRLVYGSALAMALASLVPSHICGPGSTITNRTVAGGGITVQGWQGKADGAGQVSDAKLVAGRQRPARRDRARR